MSVSEKMLDGITNVILMNERLTGVAATVAGHQQKLEHLTERVVRKETALEIVLSQAGVIRRTGQIESKE